MINGIFSSYFCGTVKLPEIENEYALGFINNELFKNFIMNEVNFKEIFGIYDESLMIDVENPEIVEQTVKEMQNNVYKDMEEITNIIVNDEKISLESENTIEEESSKANSVPLPSKAMSAPLLYRRPTVSMASRMGNSAPRRQGVYTVGGKRKTRKRNNNRKPKKTNKKKATSRKNKTKKRKNKCNKKRRSKNRK